MAYYDSNGKITIDEIAANGDIAKINQALPSLENAKNALEHLLEQGSSSKGETGAAVVEKTQELIKMLNTLINALEETKGCISKTVKHYQKLDQEVKASIQAFGLD
ncbi:MAG: hypothetical protein MR308_11280 [Lachnospiraceae bacterium]|nr:hypothetical protein [Lachnospiraceae bacterium]